MPLSREQIERFDRDGYLVIPDLLTAGDVAQLQRETAGYHDTLRGSRPPDVDVTWEPNAKPPRVQQVLNVSADAGAVVSLPGKAGTGILFGALLKHASPPNTSAKPRRSFTAVYSTIGAGHPVRQVYWSRPNDGAAMARALERCPGFTGEGPHGGQCAAGYRRRELWKLATAAAPRVSGSRAEGVTSPHLPQSLEWFAAHRPQDAPLVRFDYQQWRAGTPGVTLRQPGGRGGVSNAPGRG